MNQTIRSCGVGDGKMVQLADQVKTWSNCSPIYRDGALLQSTCLQEASLISYSCAYYLHNV